MWSEHGEIVQLTALLTDTQSFGQSCCNPAFLIHSSCIHTSIDKVGSISHSAQFRELCQL